jgi:DNA-binding cell septation regulator SpoVG
MNITRVQIHLNHGPDAKIKAFADIIIDEEFIVKGLVIRENFQGEHYVTMPFKLTKADPAIRIDVAHPITDSCRKYIEETVIDEYESVLNKIEESRHA